MLFAFIIEWVIVWPRASEDLVTVIEDGSKNLEKVLIDVFGYSLWEDQLAQDCLHLLEVPIIQLISA